MIRHNNEASQLILNEQGNLSIEFLFAIIIVSGITILFFSLSFTFVVAEIGQYIAFSAARAQAGGHVSPDDQRRLAEAKFNALLNHPDLKNLILNSSWFSLGNLQVRNGYQGQDFNDEYRQDPSKRLPYTGVRINFRANILDMNIPFLGSTTPDQGGFSAKITGFVAREPSSKECFSQIKDRYRRIMDLEPGRFDKLPKNTSGYISHMEDNGC